MAILVNTSYKLNYNKDEQILCSFLCKKSSPPACLQKHQECQHKGERNKYPLLSRVLFGNQGWAVFIPKEDRLSADEGGTVKKGSLHWACGSAADSIIKRQKRGEVNLERRRWARRTSGRIVLRIKGHVL